MDERRRALKYRAWHRGTREADMMIGGFFDRHQQDWREADLDWFERLLMEQDVDIMAWAIGREEPPVHFQGEQMEKMKKLDYLRIAR